MVETFQIAGALLLSSGVAGVVIIGLSSWFGKVWAARILEADRLRYTTELERFKNQLDQSTRLLQAQVDRTVFVGRVHFETEFKALSDIWAKVAAVRATMGQVRPMADIVPAGEMPEERERREAGRFTAFAAAFDQLVTSVDTQSPFIPEEIYRKLEEVIQIARREATEVQVERGDRDRNPLRDWYQRGREHNQELQRLATELSDLIRLRLAALAVPTR